MRFNIFTEMEREFESLAIRPTHEMWRGSEFAWVLQLSTRSKGALGIRIVERFLRAGGIPASRVKGHTNRLADNCARTYAVKFATLGEDGHYLFEQIRPDGYTHCLCFGLAPADFHLWAIPAAVLREGASPQHDPAGYTRMVEIRPDVASVWSPYGGYPERAMRYLKREAIRPRD